MDQFQTLLYSLESISKQHEREVVIELGTDRLIRWLSVYTILFLAILSKIGGFFVDSLVCHPALPVTRVNSDSMKFVTTYCWAHNYFNISSTSACHGTLNSFGYVLSDPTSLKQFVTYLPYILLMQAILFSFPIAFWHFRVGARLVGHLKFVQLLLNEIFDKVKTVASGTYKNSAYDETSKALDGRKAWQKEDEAEDQTVKTRKNFSVKCCGENQSTNEEQIEMNPSEEEEQENDDQKKIRPLGRLEKFVAGDMRDRNFFSMLCYENFASLHHLPYILSCFKVTKLKKQKAQGRYTLNEALIYLWCDEKNFNHVFLLKMYAVKQLTTSLLAIIMIVILLQSYFPSVHQDLMVSETFRCQILHENMCFLCAISRVPDTLVLYIADIIVTLAVLVLALWKLVDVRSSSTKQTAHFFDHLKETSNVALKAAFYHSPPEMNVNLTFMSNPLLGARRTSVS